MTRRIFIDADACPVKAEAERVATRHGVKMLLVSNGNATAVVDRLEADAHAGDLFTAFAGHDGLWDYMPHGPFHSAPAYHRWAKDSTAGRDPVFWAISELGATHPVGVASYLRITPEHGSIEVGHICFSPALQRSRVATEAMYLMMDWAFSKGYRRYEWKCHNENTPSKITAARYGFTFEGVFRQATVYKGRTRDTAWYAAIDAEWPAAVTMIIVAGVLDGMDGRVAIDVKPGL